MPGLVTSTEYEILILGMIGSVVFAVIATVIHLFKKK